MKKQSVSSVLAERIKQRKAVTPAKAKVRYVDFTPEEMAYDLPEDTSGFVPVGRGPEAIFNKSAKANVDLDADVARIFTDGKQVNNALRKLIEAMPPQVKEAAKLRKSA